MKLIRLHLTNFKGIREFTLDAQGQDIDVYGDNATGKTTIFDVFTWLLFNKDSSNRKDFEIKTLGPDGQPEHGLEHTVEAILELDDGQQIALKKVYQEKWTKKRGSATAEFTGHTTDHFIDGVPVKKKEYDEKIAEIADENIFRLLTDPRYFNNLHWTERRKLLLNVCGNMSDEEVIQSDKSLSKLSEILQGHSMEDYRKIIAAKRKKINQDLQSLPIRIDEVELSLPDIAGIIPEKLPEDIAKLRQELQEKQKELARLESGGEIAEKTKRLRELEAELLELQNQHRSRYEKEIQEKQKLLNQAKEKCSDLLTAIKGIEKSIVLRREDLANLNSRMGLLRARWYETNEQQFEYEQNTVCPTCGQPLPAEKLTEAREKALAQFNREKAEKLEQITAEGKQLKARLDKLADEIIDLNKKITEAKCELEEKEFAIDSYTKEIKFLCSEQSNYDVNPACVAKLAEVESVESAIEELKENNAEAVAKIKEEIRTIEQGIAALEEAAAKVKQYAQGQKRIEELKAQERKLAAEYEKLEEELYLTEQFIRTKVNLLEEKINSRFKYARFKLFDVQVNGAVVECCETLYNGVPYSSLNNGARINIGLDIINTLSEHYGFEAPIFIDNREAITQLIPVRAQVISLVVSEKDKKLRVELAEKKEMKEVV